MSGGCLGGVWKVLIENANISEQDRKLVMFGVDLDSSEEIYKATKKAILKYCGNDSSRTCSARAAVRRIPTPEFAFFSGRGRGSNTFRGRGNPRPRGDDQNFDPGRYHPKLDRSNLELDGKKINAKKDGIVMTCDFCGSFLYLWKECRDRKEERESRKFKTYANTEEVKEDEHGKDDAYAHLDDKVSSYSEAFITHHLSDLDLQDYQTYLDPEARRILPGTFTQVGTSKAMFIYVFSNTSQ